MEFTCMHCGKSFPDKMLEKETQGDVELFNDYVRSGSIMCVECAEDRVRLSSSTNLHARSKNTPDVSRETN